MFGVGLGGSSIRLLIDSYGWMIGRTRGREISIKTCNSGSDQGSNAFHFRWYQWSDRPNRSKAPQNVCCFKKHQFSNVFSHPRRGRGVIGKVLCLLVKERNTYKDFRYFNVAKDLFGGKNEVAWMHIYVACSAKALNYQALFDTLCLLPQSHICTFLNWLSHLVSRFAEYRNVVSDACDMCTYPW